MGPNRGGGRHARRGGKGGGAASGGRGPQAKPKPKMGSSSGSKTGEALQAVTLSQENQSMVQSLLQQLGPAGDAQPSGSGAVLRADGVADMKFADVERKVRESDTLLCVQGSYLSLFAAKTSTIGSRKNMKRLQANFSHMRVYRTHGGDPSTTEAVLTPAV